MGHLHRDGVLGRPGLSRSHQARRCHEGDDPRAYAADLRAVPADVELGIHLCYGDFEAKHFVEPRDGGKMVEFANALAAAIRHPLAFVHMPVPIDRTDDAFFAPLSDLRLAKDTEVYLGVVHGADGKDGTNRRIAAAANYLKGFGIACECGIARARRPDLVAAILEIHAQTSREPH